MSQKIAAAFKATTDTTAAVAGNTENAAVVDKVAAVVDKVAAVVDKVAVVAGKETAVAAAAVVDKETVAAAGLAARLALLVAGSCFSCSQLERRRQHNRSSKR